ncbi:MAG: glycosyltransferase involved in cell wall biosynthesis [Bacteroidia bacterium]
MKVWLFSYEEVISKGTNPRLLGYYQYLKEQGHKPCFCFLKGSNDIHSNYDYRAPRGLFSWPFHNLLTYFFTILFHKPSEVAYFYGPNALFIPLYAACKLRGIRVVIEKVELDSVKRVETTKDIINWRLNQLDECFAPRFADSLIVISSRLQFHYRKWSQKTTLIGAFVPYHSLDKPLKQPPHASTFTVGYLGSFGDKDDIDTLLNGFEYALKHIPGAQLKLIGKLPKRRAYLRRRPNVICIENVSNTDIHGNLQSCSVLIALRKNNDYAHYGFPSKLAEYIAAGIPVIATPTSDIPEIFVDGTNIKTVPHSDPQAFGEAIVEVYNHPTKHLEIALNAYQWSKMNWDPSVVLGKWMESVLAR